MQTPSRDAQAEMDEFHAAMKGLGHAVHNGVNKHYLTAAATRLLEAWKTLQRRWENDSR